jgi:2-oxoglutarate ferredoxin oxidoreductase subunit beta
MIRYERTKGLTDVVTHYCPGCTHGILHKLVGEVLEELGVLGKTVGIASVGCSVLAMNTLIVICNNHHMVVLAQWLLV